MVHSNPPQVGSPSPSSSSSSPDINRGVSNQYAAAEETPSCALSAAPGKNIEFRSACPGFEATGITSSASGDSESGNGNNDMGGMKGIGCVTDGKSAPEGTTGQATKRVREVGAEEQEDQCDKYQNVPGIGKEEGTLKVPPEKKQKKQKTSPFDGYSPNLDLEAFVRKHSKAHQSSEMAPGSISPQLTRGKRPSLSSFSIISSSSDMDTQSSSVSELTSSPSRMDRHSHSSSAPGTFSMLPQPSFSSLASFSADSRTTFSETKAQPTPSTLFTPLQNLAGISSSSTSKTIEVGTHTLSTKEHGSKVINRRLNSTNVSTVTSSPTSSSVSISDKRKTSRKMSSVSTGTTNGKSVKVAGSSGISKDVINRQENEINTLCRQLCEEFLSVSMLVMENRSSLKESSNSDLIFGEHFSLPEDINDMLLRHMNQVLYLKQAHTREKMYVRASAAVRQETSTQCSSPSESSLPERSKELPGVAEVASVAAEGSVKSLSEDIPPSEKVQDSQTSVRIDEVNVESVDASVSVRKNLDIKILSGGEIHSMSVMVGGDFSKSMVDKALETCIDSYHHVFYLGRKCTKWDRVNIPLQKLITADPNAVGMAGRASWVEEERHYYNISGHRKGKPVQMETLMNLVGSGACLKKSWRYFPPARERIPFLKYEDACTYVRMYMKTKIKNGYELPTIEQFKERLEQGKKFYTWYEDFNEIIRRCCMDNKDELKIFMGLLCSSSPNSGVAQNTVNALLNYRAVAQGNRPKWGSYPSRNLLNYMASCLGAPSGCKIISFLDNLTYPETSDCVTVDTYMQKFLLGSGHLSITPLEYSVIEDVYRCVSRILEIQPCRLQAAIWMTLAGDFSFSYEFNKMRRKHAFSLLPKFCSVEFETKVRTVLYSSRGKKLATSILREKLLEIGYFSEEIKKSSEEWNPEDTIASQMQRICLDCAYLGHAECFCKVHLEMIVPIREHASSTIKGNMLRRRNMAKKHGRNFRKEEESEKQYQEKSLQKLQNSPDGKIPHQYDAEKFKQDLLYINQWLLQSDPKEPVVRSDLVELEENDIYFRTHLHFSGYESTISELLKKTNFHEELLSRFESEIATVYENTNSEDRIVHSKEPDEEGKMGVDEKENPNE
eukprot:Nk52_evm1s2622 gene=Nk52_evmTU1s2622